MFLTTGFKLTSREKWEIIQRKGMSQEIRCAKKTQTQISKLKYAIQLLASNHLKVQKLSYLQVCFAFIITKKIPQIPTKQKTSHCWYADWSLSYSATIQNTIVSGGMLRHFQVYTPGLQQLHSQDAFFYQIRHVHAGVGERFLFVSKHSLGYKSVQKANKQHPVVAYVNKIDAFVNYTTFQHRFLSWQFFLVHWARKHQFPSIS